MDKVILKRRIEAGLGPEEYLALLKDKSELIPSDTMSEEQKNELNLLKLNYQRSSRIYKNYFPGGEIAELIDKIKTPQIWMIITEPWCGDSAQILPYIFKIAEISGKIKIKIILRDENPDIMDLYLSPTGARAIPKLVSYDETGNELFQWGARPAEAQDLVNRLKNEGMSKENFLEKLHLWYAKNKGKAIEFELTKIFSKFS